jgi:hypothetical protein
MNRIERLLMASREWSHPYELAILRIAAVSVLAIVLLGMVVLLFQVQSWQGAALSALIGGAAGAPCFVLGRRHARMLGNKSSAQSYKFQVLNGEGP